MPFVPRSDVPVDPWAYATFLLAAVAAALAWRTLALPKGRDGNG